ncbi:MAG TPA: xylulokinase [Candidatus Borkfalkia avistercoris]|uniref:Xylulose kinase n=1 Tax=Candidatus Borkfalkia avistercoris TaxID=2838504 RepID=A0A9D2CYI3_9FIRM|nr:xylulokinase [Candidatus Borkfalkia avistercoris]
MKSYIGIDLGTSGTKLLLVSADGRILAENTQTYEVFYPQSGWSEQNPADWFAAAMRGLKELLQGQDKSAVKGISFGGQMHGLVALDAEDNVIRPAILWNDGRTEKQTAYLNTIIGKEKLSAYTGNIAFAGFTVPKILWVKRNEPENFKKIAKIMLPKDYLIYKFSGCFATDLSDASGMLLLDVKNRRWSREMCEICGISEEQLPALYESYEVVGTLKREIAEELGLSAEVKIIAGAGDNAAAAVGTGVVGEGGCNISLGTSGTLFVSSAEYKEDRVNALHSFCHADGGWHLMGCILSAASCNAWWSEKVLQTDDYAKEQAGLEEELGRNDVYFLPYLMGERSPHNDVNARGAFIGMRPDTTRKQMTLSVLEGVTFALRDCLEAAKKNGVKIERTKLCGGGAKSTLWRKIVANVMNMPVDIPQTEQGPSYGAAMLAMVGCGEYASVRQAAEAIVRVKETVLPDRQTAERYAEKYKNFTKFYPALKGVFADKI